MQGFKLVPVDEPEGFADAKGVDEIGHAYAKFFPLMKDRRELVESIRARGLIDPIVLYEGKILDGCNRWLGCGEADVPARYLEFVGTRSEALNFVKDKNGNRRDLTASQKIGAFKLIEIEEKELTERLRADAAQRQKNAGSRGDEGGRGKKKPLPNDLGKGSDRHERSTDAARAKLAGVSRETVRQADRLAEEDPAVLEKLRDGEITLAQARRQQAIERKRAELEAKAKAARKAAKNAKANGEETWRIVRGDCLHGLADLDGEARLIFADPPYNIGIDYGSGKTADQLADAAYLDWCQKWMAACHRALTPDGSLWVMIGDEYAAHFSIILNSIGFHQRAWIKWYETFGVNQANNFNRTSRHIFYATKDRKRFVFNAYAVSRPSDRLEKYGDKRADPNGKLWDDVWQIPRLTGTAKERIPDFPTQLPLAILRPIVGCASDPGDLVVDPFSGSATTGAACIELGRRYIGFEKELKWVNLSKMRLGGMGAVDAAPTGTAKRSRSVASVAAGASAATSGRKSRGGNPR